MTLRVGYLTGEFPRATDIWIHREIAGLGQNGVEVTTFSVRRPGPEHLVGPEQREGQESTLYILELAKSSRLLSAHGRALVRSPKRYLQTALLAWRTKRPGIRGGLYQLFYFIEAVVLAQEIRARKIDHLHNHFGDSSCTVAMLAAEVGSFPFSFTLHGAAIFFEPITWRLDEKIKRSAFCVCISHFCRSQAAIFAPEATDKLHIIHCGVEPRRLTSVDHVGTGHRLLFVGRVSNVKGLAVLFDALEMLRREHPNIRLTVVGDGPDRSHFERRVIERGLTGTITFVGSKSQDDVADILSQHDIFVLPSFAEGVPVVLMEAMGSGLPVVATNVAGMTELVDDGVSGLLVRPFDVGQLTERISQLVGDADLRQRLGQAGRKKVLSDFISSDEATRLGSLIAGHRHGLESDVRPSLR